MAFPAVVVAENDSGVLIKRHHFKIPRWPRSPGSDWLGPGRLGQWPAFTLLFYCQLQC